HSSVPILHQSILHSSYLSYCYVLSHTALPKISTLSLHDALPISGYSESIARDIDIEVQNFINYCYDRAKSILTEHKDKLELIKLDRKSTRLNSSHVSISYAVFCLKKKI